MSRGRNGWLKGAWFYGAWLSGATLIGAHLEGADLTRAVGLTVGRNAARGLREPPATNG